jgi:hypothetical protein
VLVLLVLVLLVLVLVVVLVGSGVVVIVSVDALHVNNYNTTLILTLIIYDLIMCLIVLSCVQNKDTPPVTHFISLQVIPYTILLQHLDILNVRELEDLVIECIYQGLIRGQLDQKHKQLEVDFAIGRDIRPGEIEEMMTVLANWYAFMRITYH